MPRGTWIRWTDEELAWVEANATLPAPDLHRRFVETFGKPEITAQALCSLRKRNGWRTGRDGRFPKGIVPANKGRKMPYHPNSARTRFRKGHLPHNTRHAGHERVSKDGYVEISIDETNPHTGFERRYVLKHRWLWEQANGPVPEGHALKCLDGDRSNCDPSNWKLIPRAMLPRLNSRYGRDFDQAEPEVKPLILAVTELEHAVRTAAGRKGRK